MCALHYIQVLISAFCTIVPPLPSKEKQ
uniref:Uncharacterized protein n=1 Tax=Anguilla anguilla TaxID=7936 RepID=A0A0E9WD04_ANGAN